MTDRIVEILYVVSSCLLPAVLIVLVAFLAGTLVMLGGLAREALERRRPARDRRRYLAALAADSASVSDFYELPLAGYPVRFQRLTRDLRDNSLAVKKCLDDIEIDITRRLARLSLATRVGPMIGLVGTLIPLGPALTGLASGDIQALSGNLIIAFTTTVFGILIGGFAYAASLLRRAWYEQDLSDLEFIVAMQESIAAKARQHPLDRRTSRDDGDNHGSSTNVPILLHTSVSSPDQEESHA